MEEKKYYTPTIDEFHVGFEYEHYKDLVDDNDYDWHGEKFFTLLHPNHKGNGGHTIWLMRDLKRAIDDKEIRVKYLDHEDIESLGFKHEGGKLSPFGQQIYNATREDGFNTGVYYTIYHTKKNPTMVELRWESFSSYGSESGKISFYIKNKSELKRLLKQIGYERE